MASTTDAAPVADSITSIKIDGVDVPVTSEPNVDVAKAIASTPFKDWLDAKEKELVVKGIHFQGVDMFGKRVGFLKFKASVEVDGVFVPGIVFMRGGAVAILVILECDGVKHTLLTMQPRVPIGKRSWPEIPAGMLDGEGHFAGVAAKEMQEETGLVMDAKELIDLTGMVYGHDKSLYKGMVPSAGGCDEFLRLFAYTKKVTKEELAELQGKCTGLVEEGELISLNVVPYDDLWRITPDSKTLCAVLLYDKLLAAGKI